MIPLFKPLLDILENREIGTVLGSGMLTEGDKTREFERVVARRFGREYGVATTSGTVALMIACKIEAIHAVYVPDYCFIAPYNAVKLAGKTVEIEDIDKDDLSNKSIHYEYNNIYVHFNNTVDVSIVTENIIHDVSHCMGSDCSKVKGTLCVSFSAPKTVTTGQGGMILTDNKYLANEFRRYKNHGKLVYNDESRDFGGNYKFNDILASIGLAQMEKLDYMLDAKRQIAEEYKKHINTHNPDIPWVIITENPKARDLSKKLQADGIDAQCPYKPIHKLIRGYSEDFPNADWASENLVYLPSYVGLRKEDIEYICERINEYA